MRSVPLALLLALGLWFHGAVHAREANRPDRLEAERRGGPVLADPALVPQDRPWLAELYFETARALYLTSRDPAAIALTEVALARWAAPAHGAVLDAACHRHHARPTTLHGQDSAQRALADTICARHAL